MIRLVIFISWSFLTMVGTSFQASAQSVMINSKTYGADDIIGTWMNLDKILKVKIEKIGTHYFGKLIWLEKPLEPDGTTKLDKNNPDQSLRKVPFIGLRIMKDMKYKGDGIWSGGTLYDPEKGKTYGCKITLVSIGVASIRGFIGISMLGKSENFSRVSK